MAIPPTGNNALFNQPGIQSRAKRRKKKAACTCNAVEKATGAPGEQISPGITRIRGNLCNVHGRYGPCDKGVSGKGKPKKGKKPPKVKPTPEQRAQARSAAHDKNAQDVAQQMAQNDAGLSPGGSKALLAFAKGTQPDAQSGEGLAKMGLAERADDGTYRMTPTGHAVVSAMRAGDYQRTVDAISRGTDTAAKRTSRQQAAQTRQAATAARRQDAAAKRAAAQAERAKRQQERAQQAKKRGSGSPKPEQAQPKAPRAFAPAKRRQSRASVPSGPSVGGSSSAPKKTPAPAAAKPAKPAAPKLAQPLQDAAQALSDGADVSDEQLGALIRNGLVKLNKDGVPVLTAAGQRATMKAETYGGVKRSNLDDNVFAGPDRSFPIKTAQDVRDAVRSLGRTKHDKAAVKRGIIRRARAIGATDALPDEWKAEKDHSLFTVIKSSDDAPDRWLSITTTAYEDKDREIISTKAIAGAVEFGDQTGERGPLLYWHVPGLAIGDCDFQAQGGPGGRFLIEGGTFRSKAFAQLGQRLSDAGYQMSPGFIHGDDQPQNGVYDHIVIYERSAVPQNRAANYFTRYATAKEERKVIPQEKIAEYREKAAGNAEALALLDTLLSTAQKEDDTAQARNVVYKEAAALPQEIEIGGVVYTIKAMAPASMEQAADTEMADAETEQTDDGMGEMEPDGDEGMDDAAFAQMIAQAVVQSLLQELGPRLDVSQKMSELKDIVSGFATKKDDAAAAATAATQQQIAALDAKLKELTGDLPDSVMTGARQMYRPSEAAGTLLTLESAAKVKEQITNVPAGLTDPAEVAAYQLIFGNS